MNNERFIINEDTELIDTLENKKLDFKPYIAETLNKYYTMYLKEIECNSKLTEEISALDKEIETLKRGIGEKESLIRLWKQINHSKTLSMKKALFEGKLDNPCKDCLHKKSSFEEILTDTKHCNICDVPYIMFSMINDIYKFKENTR